MKSVSLAVFLSLGIFLLLVLGLSFFWLKNEMMAFVFWSIFVSTLGVYIGKKYLLIAETPLEVFFVQVGIYLNIAWAVIWILLFIFAVFWGALYGR